MNTFCHSTIAARIETAAAAIILFLTTLTSCGRSSSPEPLDQWNDGTSTLHTADPVIAEGRKLFNDKEYQNFRLTGEALTQPGSEAGLLFHTDGESGYEVIFRNGDIDGTRKSGSLASVRNLYRSLAKDGEWFDFEKPYADKTSLSALTEPKLFAIPNPDTHIAQRSTPGNC